MSMVKETTMVFITRLVLLILLITQRMVKPHCVGTERLHRTQIIAPLESCQGIGWAPLRSVSLRHHVCRRQRVRIARIGEPMAARQRAIRDAKQRPEGGLRGRRWSWSWRDSR